jgi:hypothetical protein
MRWTRCGAVVVGVGCLLPPLFVWRRANTRAATPFPRPHHQGAIHDTHLREDRGLSEGTLHMGLRLV